MRVHRQSMGWSLENTGQKIADHTHHMLDSLEQVADEFPFVVISSIIFLAELAFYFNHGMQLKPNIALVFIGLSGLGCMLSAVILITENRFFRTLQGISSFVGNASFMYIVSSGNA